jgi:CBS domain-containing protein
VRTIDALYRSGVAVAPDCTLQAAATAMASAGVGSLAVLDGDRLVGIVTDRDLVRRGLARGLSADARVDAAMSSPVVTIQADADLHEAFELFRTNAVRRVAVMRGDRFAGMLTLDDLLVRVSIDLADLVRPVTAEILFAHRDHQVPAVT